MGMFDTVVAVCPRCSGIVRFQSKAGECEMREYSVDRVPVPIANSLHGSTEKCDECSYAWTLNSAVMQRQVPMWLS